MQHATFINCHKEIGNSNNHQQLQSSKKCMIAGGIQKPTKTKTRDIIASVINLINKKTEIPKEELASNIDKIHPIGPIKG